MNESLKLQIKDMLFHTNLSSYKIGYKQSINTKYNKPSFKWFDPTDLLVNKELVGEDLFTDVSVKDLDANLNYTYLEASPEDKGHNLEFTAIHVKKSSPESIRHLPFNPYPIHVEIFNYFKDKTFIGHKHLCFKNRSNKEDVAEWIGVNPQVVGLTPSQRVKAERLGALEYDEDSNVMFSSYIELALYYQFNSHFFWHVDLGLAGGKKMRLYVNSDQLKQLFKDRGIADGKTRRDALLNWVMGHNRTRHKKEGLYKTHQVKKHMRGSYDFSWDGLECTVRPSKSDLIEQEKNIQSEKTEELILLVEQASQE